MRTRLNVIFAVLSVLLFIGVDFGSDLTARNVVSGQSFSDGVYEHLHDTLGQPVATVLLACPFLALGWLSASIARRLSAVVGLAVMLFGVLLLGGIYFLGYQGAEVAMAQHKWTAATMSVAFLPIESTPVLLLCAGIRWLALRRQHAAKI